MSSAEGEGQVHKLTVSEEAEGERLDKFAAVALPELSRTAVRRLIDEGEVTVNGEFQKPAYNVQGGDEVVVRVPPPRPTSLQAEAIPLDVVYEDRDVLVVNKPPGLVVHPGAGHPSGTLVNAVLAHCPDLRGVGGELRPGIVHRLDKDTSGVMVVAKHDQALRELQRQFKRRTVGKIYVALLVGNLPEDEGIIEAPIARHPRRRKRMAVVAGGKNARTRWRVRKRLADAEGRRYTLVDVRLMTGRTHQIRVHLSWLGFPLVGDETYGPRRPHLDAPRQFLHARSLTFDHPFKGERMTFRAPLPDDLQHVLASLRVI
jgi:23S rRNA pseudouridine1911/1915/1917 synthase